MPTQYTKNNKYAFDYKLPLTAEEMLVLDKLVSNVDDDIPSDTRDLFRLMSAKIAKLFNGVRL